MKRLLSILFIVLTINAFGQTAISAPSQAYNVSMSNIGTGSFKISWTNPT